MTVGCSKLMQNINFYIHYSLVHANSVIFLKIPLEYFSSHLHSCLFPAVFLQLGICQVRSTLLLYFPKNWWKYWDFFSHFARALELGKALILPHSMGLILPHSMELISSLKWERNLGSRGFWEVSSDQRFGNSMITQPQYLRLPVNLASQQKN